MPRKYNMERRAAAVEDTRRRIVEATVTCHAEKGILATSWQDIAQRADVAVGTVYRHFPELPGLMQACGHLVDERLALPATEDVPELFRDARSARERIARLVAEIFGVYERGAASIECARSERHALPPLQQWHEMIEERLDLLVATALDPLGADDNDRRLARALTDLTVWRSLLERGFSETETRDLTTRLLVCGLRSRLRDRGKQDDALQPSRSARTPVQEGRPWDDS